MAKKKVSEGAIAAAASAVEHMATINTDGEVQRVFGWQRQLPDHRDKVVSLRRLQAERTTPLPHKYDMSPEAAADVRDQGQLGACTAFATLGVIRFTEEEETHGARPALAELFTYYCTRAQQGTVAYDSGGTLRGAFKSLNQMGYVLDKQWAYDPRNFKVKPTAAVLAEAKKHALRAGVDYAAVPQTETALKTVLAAHNPIAFGFSVYRSFMSQQVAKTGVVPMPTKAESMVGGHAVVLVGYDDDRRVYIVKNSWSKLWGAQGFCFMPYDYIHNKNLASDFWTATSTPKVAT